MAYNYLFQKRKDSTAVALPAIGQRLKRLTNGRPHLSLMSMHNLIDAQSIQMLQMQLELLQQTCERN